MDHKEGWAWKNWCFWTVVLEKTLESPLDFKEIKTVNPKGNQPWVLFIRRPVAEAQVPILRPLMQRADLIGKDPAAGKDWRQKEKGVAKNEMVRQHHRANSERQCRIEEPGVLQSTGSESQTQLSDWTTTILLMTITLYRKTQTSTSSRK